VSVARYSEPALRFLVARAIEPEVAAELGVTERGDAIVFPYTARDGTTFERSRSLNGAGPAKVRQPTGQPLDAWWPAARPSGDDARLVLVTEGESDALAAICALRVGPLAELRDLPVLAIPGTGYPVDRLADELAAVGAREALLAMDADDAGRKYAKRAAEALRARGVRPIPVELLDGTDLAACLAAVEDRGEWLAETLIDASAAADEPDPARPEPEPRDWLESAADLLAAPDPGPTPFAVESLLARSAIGAVIGPWKVGKTWAVLELAVSIAAGVAAFGRFAVERGPVILVLEESGRDALYRRLDKLARGHNLRPADLRDLHVAPNRRVRLDDEEWRGRLMDAAQRIRPRAIFLDPFVRIKGAGVDENVQREVAPALDFMRDLRDESGAAVVFVHHVGHENKSRMRGSSDLEGYWESKLTLSRDPKTGVATIAAEHREAEAPPELRYVLRPHELSDTISLVPLEGEGEEALIDSVARYVEQHPGLIGDEVVAGVRRKAVKVRDALEAGRLAGRLWKSSGGRDDSGRDYRRGGWYPAAHGGPQLSMSRPDEGTGRDESPAGAEVVPSSGPRGAGRDDSPGRDGGGGS
jgi:hypothetical protein